jgi:hypothetical protein
VIVLDAGVQLAAAVVLEVEASRAAASVAAIKALSQTGTNERSLQDPRYLRLYLRGYPRERL